MKKKKEEFYKQKEEERRRDSIWFWRVVLIETVVQFLIRIELAVPVRVDRFDYHQSSVRFGFGFLSKVQLFRFNLRKKNNFFNKLNQI